MREKTPDFSSPLVEDPNLRPRGLPEELVWYTSSPGVFGSPRAKKGGRSQEAMTEFPPTFRTLGPNSQGPFLPRLSPRAGLVTPNPDTREWMPQLATHWAFGADGRSVYFKLNEKARWSDGEKINPQDYLFALKMMRSKGIKDPWYNYYYQNVIEDVRSYGDSFISVHGKEVKGPQELLETLNITPRPEHHYGGEIPLDWVERYQWVYEPTPGPYYLGDYKKGESITFRKVKDWWGYDYDYNRYRYNVEEINFQVISGGRDMDKQYFMAGRMDTLYLIIPQEWADSESYEPLVKGYADRHFFYYTPLRGLAGLYFNTQAGVLASQDVRRGMYYAINMDKMIATTLRGEYERYHNIGMGQVLGKVNFNDSTLRMPPFDPDKAGEFFDRAGYNFVGSDGIRRNKKGEPLSFELLYPYTHHTERLSVLKEEAKKAGVEILLNNQTEGAYSNFMNKNYQAYFGTTPPQRIPNPRSYFHSSNATVQGKNYFMVEDPKLDQVIEAYEREKDLEKKAILNRAVERRVRELALIIPSYVINYQRSISWKWVRYPAWLSTRYYGRFDNQIYNTMRGYNGYSWIDQDIQREVLQGKAHGKTSTPDLYKVKPLQL